MTEKEEVLRYMKTHKSISTIEGACKIFTADLRAVIRDLKKEYAISYKWIYKTNIYGRPIRYKRYRLSKATDIFDGYTPYNK